MEKQLDDTHQRHDQRIEYGLEQDWTDERRAAIAIDEVELVGHQDHLADDQRQRRGDQEVRQREPVVVDHQVGGKDDQVEGAEEIDGRRQDDLQLLQQEASDRGCGHIRPPSTTKFCAEISRLSSAARNSAMRAMSGG